LKPKVKKVIVGLGLGENFEYWGYDKKIIFEGDWGETVALDDGIAAYIIPARHYSGRGFTRDKTLWASFVFISPNSKVFIGGDGGYGTHFAETGNKFGEFDLAILPNGQYDENWKYIHLLPEEVVQAAHDLHAKKLLPVHNSKFALANHTWNEPQRRIHSLMEGNKEIHLVTPMIGELVNLSDTTYTSTKWWEVSKR
jgi:L-ascorbate metabolism protein UlaG (beta-lactamase superfamily)